MVYDHEDTRWISKTMPTATMLYIVILQIKLRESHWLFRRVYGSIFTAAAAYIYGARDVKETTLWRNENPLFLTS